MKTIIFIAACMFSATCFGQTKLISFRSHSGSNANFRTAVEHNMFDIGNSNFGTRTEEKNEIDQVILKRDHNIIVKIRVFSRTVPLEREFKYRTTRYDTLTASDAAGFFKENNMDSLKTRLQKKYDVSTLDSTRFIGFDKKFKQTKAPGKK